MTNPDPEASQTTLTAFADGAAEIDAEIDDEEPPAWAAGLVDLTADLVDRVEALEAEAGRPWAGDVDGDPGDDGGGGPERPTRGYH